jgi:hypothetical protein
MPHSHLVLIQQVAIRVLPKVDTWLFVSPFDYTVMHDCAGMFKVGMTCHISYPVGSDMRETVRQSRPTYYELNVEDSIARTSTIYGRRQYIADH